tara:strand:- start:54 stop:1448 length:1395 start_codon:yes stop_codon:yes gene_type:complete
MYEVRRKFSLNDQVAFAEISGDYNPVHLDNLVARRSIFGSIIVHGMHLVLWAINEQITKNENKSLSIIKVNFMHAVSLENKVTYAWEDNEENTIGKIIINKKVVARIEIYWGNISFSKISPINSCPPIETSKDIDMKTLSNKKESFPLFLPEDKINNLFPNLLKKLNVLQISTLLATTRLIGNKCPGLYSIFTKLNINFEKSNPINQFEYQLIKYDNRFGSSQISFKSPNSEGIIDAFQRPKPIHQKSYKIIKDYINSREFIDIKALVIGGSRGLGEVATKILCAGGANVTSTYFSGKKEAEIITKEINLIGDEIEYIYFDACKIIKPNNFEKYNLLIYMATPFISTTEKDEFNEKIFRKFCDYYITGFLNLCNLLSNKSEIKILYPSSIYIDQVPPNLVEYSAAKAAGEIACSFLEKNNKKFKIFVPRFNRLETDQTSSLIPQNLEDSTDILFNAIKETLRKS